MYQLLISMSLLFHGKTAIITGGGGALGSRYALDLAKRGCNIVVNDVLHSVTNASGSSDYSNVSAEKVVKEIVAGGGKAITNYDSAHESPEQIVDAALKEVCCREYVNAIVTDFFHIFYIYIYTHIICSSVHATLW